MKQTRQQKRAALRAHYYNESSIAPNYRGPHLPRHERRKVACALASRDFKAGKSVTSLGIMTEA